MHLYSSQLFSETRTNKKQKKSKIRWRSRNYLHPNVSLFRSLSRKLEACRELAFQRIILNVDYFCLWVTFRAKTHRRCPNLSDRSECRSSNEDLRCRPESHQHKYAKFGRHPLYCESSEPNANDRRPRSSSWRRFRLRRHCRIWLAYSTLRLRRL